MSTMSTYTKNLPNNMGDICMILIQNGRRFITHSPTISSRYVIPNCSQKLFHDLAPIFGGLSQSDNLFEIKPPSIPGKNGYLCPAYSQKSGAQISRKKCAETEI